MEAQKKGAARSTRRFTFVEGGSSKFWEVRVDGSTLVVRFGKIGTEGQTKEKSLASPAAAKAEAEKLVREKTGKGYVEG
ncbi:MAG: WGR domain-containing protein [Deltaproteobacteria bacterium]|nr:WGR domain-containing protein [Deltaproteobacteria bacterium]